MLESMYGDAESDVSSIISDNNEVRSDVTVSMPNNIPNSALPKNAIPN